MKKRLANLSAYRILIIIIIYRFPDNKIVSIIKQNVNFICCSRNLDNFDSLLPFSYSILLLATLPSIPFPHQLTDFSHLVYVMGADDKLSRKVREKSVTVTPLSSFQLRINLSLSISHFTLHGNPSV